MSFLKDWRLSLLILIGLMVLGVTLAMAWQGHSGTLKTLLFDLRERTTAMSPVWMVGSVFFASVFGVPVGVLMPLVAVLLPPWLAAVCLEVGLLLGGSSSFLLAKVLGAERIQARLGARGAALNQRLGNYGFLAVLTARLLPLAPFAIANLLLGASPIRFRSFFWATAVGLLPGITLTLVGIEALLRYL